MTGFLNIDRGVHLIGSRPFDMSPLGYLTTGGSMATLFKNVLLATATFLIFFYSATFVFSVYFNLDSALLPF